MTRSKTSPDSAADQSARSGGQARYSSNKLVVRLKREHRKNSDAQAELLGSFPPSSQYETDFDELGIAVIRLPNGVDPVEIARDIEQHEIVEYAEPEFLDSGSSK